MNVKQVLEEYSTLTLDPKLKEEYIKTFYESSERFLLSFIEKIVDNQEGPDFQSIIKKNLWRWRVDNYEKYCNEYLIQLIRSGLICREFNDCFPNRGLILDLTDFGKWLKKYGIQYNLFEPGSSIYTKIQGPGFIRFRDFIKNVNNKFLRQINMLKADEVGKDFMSVFYLRAWKWGNKDWSSEQWTPSRTPPPKRKIIFDKITEMKAPSEMSCDYVFEKFENTEWRLFLMTWPSLASEIPIDENQSKIKLHLNRLGPEDILSVIAGDYLIPFQICTFGVLVYGLFNLVESRWLRNPAWEEFKENHKIPKINVSYTKETESKRKLFTGGTPDCGPM